MAYKTVSILKQQTEQAAGGAATVQISEVFSPTLAGSRGLRVDYKVSGVAVTGSLAIKLQGRATTQMTWANLSSASASKTISADGEGSINLIDTLDADKADMPLKNQLRVVIVGTDAADEVTVEKLLLTQ